MHRLPRIEPGYREERRGGEQMRARLVHPREMLVHPSRRNGDQDPEKRQRHVRVARRRPDLARCVRHDGDHHADRGDARQVRSADEEEDGEAGDDRPPDPFHRRGVERDRADGIGQPRQVHPRLARDVPSDAVEAAVDALLAAAGKRGDCDSGRERERRHLHHRLERIAVPRVRERDVVEQDHRADDDAALVRQEACDEEGE